LGVIFPVIGLAVCSSASFSALSASAAGKTVAVGAVAVGTRLPAAPFPPPWALATTCRGPIDRLLFRTPLAFFPCLPY
jgi:hypothetical protein